MTTQLTEILNLTKSYETALPVFRPYEGENHRPITAYIDHTLLKPEGTPAQVQQICREAVDYHFAAVCVNPIFVPLVAKELSGSPVATCTVVGFPLGASAKRSKVEETRIACEEGATEIDMVVAIGLLKAGEVNAVMDDLLAVVEMSHRHHALVKVILEMALLNQHEKILGCLLSQAAGAEFVKTSTGFGPGGATVADVELMRRVVGPKLGVKAAGGVRSLADAQAMLKAGASRLGSSAGVKIAQELG